MDGLGKRLVHALVENRSLDILAQHAISESDIYEDARDAIVWIQGYLQQYGNWPSQSVVCENLKWDLPSEIDDVGYICEMVRKRALKRELTQSMHDAGELLLEQGDPDAAYGILREEVLRLRERSTGGRIENYGETRTARYEEYLQLQKERGYEGIPSPWSKLNLAIQGFVNGTLNVALAMTGTGKTWFCCILAQHALMASHRVLFISLEMPANKINRRIDSVHFKIPFWRLRDGKVDPHQEKKWQEGLTSPLDGTIFTADKKSVATVADAVGLVYEFQPDLVIVDGGYRFKAGSKSGWEQAASVVRDLQIAAEVTDKPWIVTTQMGDSAETGKTKKAGSPMRAWGVRYAKEWLLDSDVVLGIQQTPAQRELKMLELHVLKIREGFGSNADAIINLKWDADEVDFSEMTEEDAQTPLGEDVVF